MHVCTLVSKFWPCKLNKCLAALSHLFFPKCPVFEGSTFHEFAGISCVKEVIFTGFFAMDNSCVILEKYFNFTNLVCTCEILAIDCHWGWGVGVGVSRKLKLKKKA